MPDLQVSFFSFVLVLGFLSLSLSPWLRRSSVFCSLLTISPPHVRATALQCDRFLAAWKCVPLLNVFCSCSFFYTRLRGRRHRKSHSTCTIGHAVHATPTHAHVLLGTHTHTHTNTIHMYATHAQRWPCVSVVRHCIRLMHNVFG